MARASLNSTVTSVTVKRSHVEQIIEAWNGLSDGTAAPLVLNHSSQSSTALTPLKIKVNSASTSGGNAVKALHIVNQNNADLFYVTATGTVFPGGGTFSGGLATAASLKFDANQSATGMYGGSTSVNITVNNSRTFGSEIIDNVNYNIFNAGLYSSDSMETDFAAIVLKYLIPTAFSGSLGVNGVRQIFRAYNYDNTASPLKTRDYTFRTKATAFQSGTSTGAGYLELFTTLDGGNHTTIAKFNSDGTISGNVAPNQDWPSYAANQTTVVNTTTTSVLPKGGIPVYKVVRTGPVSSNYTHVGAWSQFPVGADGLTLVTDSTTDSGLSWATYSSGSGGGGYARTFLFMGA
jgi:hypothetical protein